jgi:predicted deacetylase
VSGIGEETLGGSARFADELDARRVPLSWLVTPRPAAGRHGRDGAGLRWLRGRLDGGDGLVLDGSRPRVGGGRAWWPTMLSRATRSAEFAMLSEHEARERLLAATRALAALGLTTAAFAPPGWRASEGTLAAVRALGFRVCALRAGVRLMNTGALLGGQVLTGAASTPSAVLGVAAEAALVRVSLRGPDLADAPGRRRALALVDAALLGGATGATYESLAMAPLPANSSGRL